MVYYLLGFIMGILNFGIVRIVERLYKPFNFKKIYIYMDFHYIYDYAGNNFCN